MDDRFLMLSKMMDSYPFKYALDVLHRNLRPTMVELLSGHPDMVDHVFPLLDRTPDTPCPIRLAWHLETRLTLPSKLDEYDLVSSLVYSPLGQNPNRYETQANSVAHFHLVEPDIQVPDLYCIMTQMDHFYAGTYASILVRVVASVMQCDGQKDVSVLQ